MRIRNAEIKPEKNHLYPTKPARPKVKKLSINAVPVVLPRASTPPMPPVTKATSRDAFCHGVTAVTFAVSSTAVGGGVTGGGIARGTGGSMLPLWTTSEPRTTSSPRSTAKLPSPPRESRNLVMLLEYKVDDCVGNLEGRSV